MLNFEIEKKYLIKEIPFPLDDYRRTDMEQSYLSVFPTIRIRREGDRFVLTVKGEGSLKKIEIEREISEQLYKKLLKYIISKTIIKTRYYIPLKDGLTAELDIYFGFLQGLLTVEVEFENMEDAMGFKPPEWFSKDVTFAKRFSNASLSKLSDKESIKEIMSEFLPVVPS